MECISLVPHDTIVRINKNQRIVIPRSNNVARAVFETEFLYMANGIPIHIRKTRKINALPPPRKGVLYLVSSICQDNDDSDRQDLISADTTNGSYLEKGRVIEVDKLVQFYK